MLELHGRYSELVQTVFSADQQFYGALDKVMDSLLYMCVSVCVCLSVCVHWTR